VRSGWRKRIVMDCRCVIADSAVPLVVQPGDFAEVQAEFVPGIGRSAALMATPESEMWMAPAPGVEE
jgi:hypothetical protein